MNIKLGVFTLLSSLFFSLATLSVSLADEIPKIGNAQFQKKFDCQYSYSPTGATAAQRKTFNFPLNVVSLFVPEDRLSITPCEVSSTNLLEPRPNFRFSLKTAPRTFPKCFVPALEENGARQLDTLLRKTSPNQQDYSQTVQLLEAAKTRKNVGLILNCQTYLEQTRLVSDYISGEQARENATTLAQRRERYGKSTNDGGCYAGWWSYSSLNGCDQVKADIDRLEIQEARYEQQERRRRDDERTGRRVNLSCFSVAQNATSQDIDKAVCEHIKQACNPVSFPAVRELNCTNAGQRNLCTTTGGTMTTVGGNPRCQCPADKEFEAGADGGSCKPKVELDCKDGAAVGTNEFGERACVCPVTGDDMRHIQPVYVNEKCEVPSVNTCRSMDSRERYVFQNNQCRACQQGLSINGTACGCFKGYFMSAGGCTPCPAGQTTDGEGPNTQASCKAEQTVPAPVPENCTGQGGTAGEGQIKQGNRCLRCEGNSVPNASKDACVPNTNVPDPACRSGIRKSNGQCCMRVDLEANRCLDTDSTQKKQGDACVVQGTNEEGTIGSDGRTCEVRRCLSGCPSGQQCVSGRCQAQQPTTCQQGQILQGNQCVTDPRAQQQNDEQRCRQQGGEMVQGRCVPRQPNAQQPKQQQQGNGMTPQQQQQMQQMQAMQECQMRQPPGAWQWNGFQCLPNPNYRPQGYGVQPSVTGGVVCNFFGVDTIEVPAGERFSVTYDVAGARREIKVDTSPKSTTQYSRQAPTSTGTTTNNSVMSQYGYGTAQDPNMFGSSIAQQQSSIQGQATITAPKKKGKLKVSLIIDAVRQNSEACKPIEVTVIDAVPQDTSGTSSYNSGGDSYPATAYENQTQDPGPSIETPSEIIAQNRANVSSKQQVDSAPADDDAYAYLCRTLGIGCAKDEPPVSETPRIRDLQVGRTNEITIDPDAEDPADLPNIGDLPNDGQIQSNGQPVATDIGIDGDGKQIVHSAILDYLGDNGQYAPPIGPGSDNSGVLNSSDDQGPEKTEDRVGKFTRLWRWFLNLLGFGPEYVG